MSCTYCNWNARLRGWRRGVRVLSFLSHCRCRSCESVLTSCSLFPSFMKVTQSYPWERGWLDPPPPPSPFPSWELSQAAVIWQTSRSLKKCDFFFLCRNPPTHLQDLQRRWQQRRLEHVPVFSIWTAILAQSLFFNINNQSCYNQ